MKVGFLLTISFVVFLVNNTSAQGVMAGAPDTDSLVIVSANYLAMLEHYQHQYSDNAQDWDEFTPRSIDLSSQKGKKSYLTTSQSVQKLINFSIPDDQEFSFELLDQNSELIMSQSAIFGDNQINIEHLAPGTYRLIFRSPTQTLEEEIIKN